MKRLPIKFRMPKSVRTWAHGSQWKELFMTIMATTISIILTFGTAGLLERCQRVEDRKMSAMMVMSNIEQFSRQLELMVQDMAYRDSVATWLLSLPLDQLDLIPPDEMRNPINTVVALDLLSHDKTAEGIFSNSSDTWKNLGNFQFIDNVGSCFSEMNDIEKYWNDWVNDNVSIVNDILTHLQPGEHTQTKLLSNNKFRQTLENFHARQNWLQYVLSYCRFLNKKNMELIGISEEEVMAFTDERERHSQDQEPSIADFRTEQLNPDSLTTLRPMIEHIDSILQGKIK
ncbi:MAG: hypothetical protein IJK41_01140 [Muribaculaceae bacterium]|nr:hypothetical protein [Muribaculaceae bacterium]